MNINIKKSRIEIERIIRTNLKLMNSNNKLCWDVADTILAHLTGMID